MFSRPGAIPDFNFLMAASISDGCADAEASLAGPHPVDACRSPSAPCGVGAGPTSWTAVPTWQPPDGHAPPINELVLLAAGRRGWARDGRSLSSPQESP